MYAVRRWVSRHPRIFEHVYAMFERMLLCLNPLFRRVGYERMDQPVAAVEKLGLSAADQALLLSGNARRFLGEAA